MQSSVGSKGDSYDKAMAESLNAFFKGELIYREGPCGSVEHVVSTMQTGQDASGAESTHSPAKKQWIPWARATGISSIG